ncbi:hypothetical protein [Vibrio fluminensis]|uniref:hypothetical protein n=1 Tax=Vibrio fluminensis TaxID=2783614 RepID=UPI001E3694B3|nr:hypothetical protein [Vibrio fluminensis]
MSDYSYFCGIDLAKNHFSIHAVDQHDADLQSMGDHICKARNTKASAYHLNH